MKTSLRNLYILPALTAGLGLLLALPAVVQAQISYQTLDDPLAVYLTYANGISGDKIVGQYVDYNGAHGYLYANGSFTTLDDPSGVGSTTAQGIDGGNIVGWYRDSSGGYHGFLYNGSEYTTLDDPNAVTQTRGGYGGTFVNGISGTNIVGYYTDGSGNVHGFLYNGSTYTTLDDPLATPRNGYGTFALGISGGSIVGYYSDYYSNPHGYLYTNGTYITLDDLGGVGSTIASGIDGGNIVGSSGNSSFVVFGYKIITMDGIPYFISDFTALNDPGGSTSASGISGNSIVGGYGGDQHGFVATVSNYTITVSASPNAGGTVSGGGTFVSGSSHTVEARANTGYTFTNWTENGIVVSSSPSYNVTVNGNVSLVANFAPGGGGVAYQTLDDPLAGSGSGGGTFALGICASNIVGSYVSNDFNGFLCNGGICTTLNVPNPNYPFTIATGISGSNIVGWYADPGSEAHGFLYTGGSYTTLNVPGAAFTGGYYPPGGYGLLLFESSFDGYGGTYASGVSGGSVVGWYTDVKGDVHGFLYNGGTYTTLDDPDGVGSTYAQGIDGDNIVGWYIDTNGYTHGFIYNGKTYTTLDDPNGVGSTYAQGISGSNIVGWYVNNISGDHGFLYNGSTYTTLDVPNALGGGSTFAQGISGTTIVGWYFDSLGNPHGFTDSLGNLQTGSLQVTITPAGAITAGAQWQVDGGPSQNSGATVTNLSVGNHTVSFSTISGWTTPTNQILFLIANSTVTAIGTYVAKPPQVTTSALPNGTNGLAYSQQLSAICGQLPYSWSLISGSLPSGLTLATDGLISGTPTNNGPFDFTVKVTDALSTTATQRLTLTVVSLPSIPFTFTTNNGTITITGYTGPGGTVIIPTNINNLLVTSIGNGQT